MSDENSNAMAAELDKAWAAYRAAREAADNAARYVEQAKAELKSRESFAANADSDLAKAEKRLLGVTGIEVKAVADSMLGSYAQGGVRK